MGKATGLSSAILSIALAGMVGCTGSGPSQSPAGETAGVRIVPHKLEMFEPLPAAMAAESNPISEEKVALGRMLYYEGRLSKSEAISCNTCHRLDAYGVDGRPVSTGHEGQKGHRNAPTVYNAAGHIAQFWDGRAADVEEQAKGPILNPIEMAMPGEKDVVQRLKSIPGYVEAFNKAFPQDRDPVTYDNMARAIGAFERKLLTPSQWDKFLRGEATALTDEEKAGFNAFMAAGCNACHNGAYLGGTMYQKAGLVKPWPDTSDLGRYGVTNQQSDKMVFKVPSLRNIEKTGPYFHDGSVDSLEDAVKMMAEYQLGKNLTEDEVSSIVAWLKTLTGEIPADTINEPELPPSTD